MDSEQLKQPENETKISKETTASNIETNIETLPENSSEELPENSSKEQSEPTLPTPVAEPRIKPENQPEILAEPSEIKIALDEDLQPFAEIKGDGSLLLKATPFSPERIVATLQADTADAVLHSLRERFKDLSSKVEELAKEWESTEDKTKLASKVSRITDYLQHAVAVGDFLPLYQQAARWDNFLQTLAEKGFAAKQALVEKAEAIAAGEEVKDAIMTFRDLTEQWKKIGHTDKSRDDILWKRLDAARDKIYEQRRLNHEAEIAELNNKLDLKMEIVEKAERFAASDDWKEATEGFKILMEEWKESGHTFNEKNEALWQRFIAAKNVFFDRKKQHYEVIHDEQEKNFEAKNLLVTEAESLAESIDWNKTTLAYTTIMDKWKDIGRVPREKENDLWDRLSKAKDIFFNAKRQHFATMRVAFDDNYAQKMALIKRAEQLQHSTDWRNATDEFAELMEEWKKIGAVAHEHSEPLWERFTKARRAFFNNKDADRDKRRAHFDKAHNERIGQTEVFLRQLKNEIKEDAENLADHHLSLSKLGDSKIDKQIRANLERLIEQSAPRVAKKLEKIASVEAQLAELTNGHDRKGKNEKKKKPEKPTQKNEQSAPDLKAEMKPDTSDQETIEPIQENHSIVEQTNETKSPESFAAGVGETKSEDSVDASVA
ncbi:MAG: DUF349 domain-containing protein [Chitinophagaceae bacterium]